MSSRYSTASLHPQTQPRPPVSPFVSILPTLPTFVLPASLIWEEWHHPCSEHSGRKPGDTLNFSFPFLPLLSSSPFHDMLLSLPTCALNTYCPVRCKPLSSHIIMFQPRSIKRHFQELLMLSLPLYLCICCSFFLGCPFLPHLLRQLHIPEDSALEALSEHPYLSGRE